MASTRWGESHTPPASSSNAAAAKAGASLLLLLLLLLCCVVVSWWVEWVGGDTYLSLKKQTDRHRQRHMQRATKLASYPPAAVPPPPLRSDGDGADGDCPPTPGPASGSWLLWAYTTSVRTRGSRA